MHSKLLSTFLGTGLCVLLAGCGSSSHPPQSTTPAAEAQPAEASAEDSSEMIAQLDAFLAAPTSSDPAPVVSMMTNSPLVMVVISEKVVPAEVLNQDYSPLLIASFAAGNMCAQLASGTKGDNPVAGVRAMLMVYAALKAEGAMSEAPALESMVQHETDGTLEESLAAE